MSTKNIRKPHPDAIATIYGWALPKTGEILVAKRGLPNPVKDFKPNRPYKPEITKTVVKEMITSSMISNVEIEPGIPPENELPIPTTPEELDKLLGSDTKRKGPGRPTGAKMLLSRNMRQKAGTRVINGNQK